MPTFLYQLSLGEILQALSQVLGSVVAAVIGAYFVVWQWKKATSDREILGRNEEQKRSINLKLTIEGDATTLSVHISTLEIALNRMVRSLISIDPNAKLSELGIVTEVDKSLYVALVERPSSFVIAQDHVSFLTHSERQRLDYLSRQTANLQQTLDTIITKFVDESDSINAASAYADLLPVVNLCNQLQSELTEFQKRFRDGTHV